MPNLRSPVPVSQWTDARHRRGLWGERMAMAFLVHRGWHIEAHRFRLGHHDVDIVIRRGRLVAFVEVKTRSSGVWGAGAESIGWRKRLVIGRVAEVWRQRHGRPDEDYRFDVVEVTVAEGRRYGVRHMEDAWRMVG